jgi:hypothetical protein
MEEPKGFSREEIISALKGLYSAWEGDLPGELPPELAAKMERLRIEVKGLLDQLLAEHGEAAP